MVAGGAAHGFAMASAAFRIIPFTERMALPRATGAITSWAWCESSGTRIALPAGRTWRCYPTSSRAQVSPPRRRWRCQPAAALGRLAGHELPPEMRSDVAFRAEHDYVGVSCGRMDQTVIAQAVAGTAMFFNTATSARSRSCFPFRIWIIPTRVEQALADSGYNARRRECESALDRCRQRWPELLSLAALDPSLLPALLPAPLDRRARHARERLERDGPSARSWSATSWKSDTCSYSAMSP